MKKDLATHFSFMIAFFVLISLYKDWIAVKYLPFWFGGILGTLLPDVDHLIYVYVIEPKDAISQKAAALISQRQTLKTWDLLATTRGERKELVFHTAYFQVIFVVFALWIMTSSGSLLGIGLVLAFSLHLLIDEVIDLLETGNLDFWFQKLPVQLNKSQKQWFLIGNAAALVFLGFFL